jgi:putative endonuclease
VARHNEIGKIGEDIAEKWLVSRGMTVIERNYRKKWGEIDIVSRGTNGKIHFVEVKSVSYETKTDLLWAVSHGTHRPEENVHQNKQDRLKRAIQTWLKERKFKGGFQIDILVVYLVPREKYARVKCLENVIFE